MKIKRFVPSFKATIPFYEGIKKVLSWFDEDGSRKWIDNEVNKKFDKIIEAYEKK